jgi:uncharacterized protein YndB with AHSA1/START domain
MSDAAAPEPTFEEGRTIELEVDVQASPEQVWEAIATGPGITSWFVPTEVHGDTIHFDFGPGLGEDTGTITVSEAPHRFRYESPQRDRVLAYEVLVEARAGGSCIVRLVNSGFGTGEDWDDQYDGMTKGWTLFLLHLRIAVEHFAGEPVASIVATGQVPDAQAMDVEEGWAVLRAALAVPEVLAVGELVTVGHAGDGPYVVGRVQHVEDDLLLVLLDGAPGRGYAYVGAEAFNGGVMVSAYLYLFGPDAEATRDALADRWYGWMQREFARLEGDPHEPADVG